MMSDEVSSGEIAIEETLRKLQKLFDFTSEIALNDAYEGRAYSLETRISAANAAARIAHALLGPLELGLMDAFLDQDETGDPSLRPDSWPKTDPPESPSQPGDNPINPDELDI